MPRTRTVKKAPEPTPGTTLVAAAVDHARTPKRVRSKAAAGESWQKTAWEMYDQCGELRAGANWLGNSLSRVRIKVMKGEEEITSGLPFELMEQFFGGADGQSQFLRTEAVHLTVPGESWVIGYVAPDLKPGEGALRWIVCSDNEVKAEGESWLINRGDGNQFRIPNEGSVVMRVWRPHPRSWAHADSPVRPLLGILNELLQLTKHVGASIDSRLAGAGILFVPNNISVTPPPSGNVTNGAGAEPVPGADPFMTALEDAMLAPISDQDDPAAVIPIIAKVPPEALGNVQHMRFDTAFDPHLMELRTEAIRRIGLGMDLPVEILLGTGDSNHWGAWAIDEAAIKIHIEPMMELILDAVASGYFHPSLQAGGVGDWTDYWLLADTSDLRQRPNHSQEALELHNRGELNGEALRRETGFEEGDAPDDTERQAGLLRAVALAGATPEMAQDALRQLGVTLTVAPASEPAPAALPAPVVEIRDRDTREIPEQAASLMAALTPQLDAWFASKLPPPAVDNAAVNAANIGAQLLVHRALERAHNKAGRRGGAPVRPIDAAAADAALADAWTKLPEVALSLDLDPDKFRGLLHTYCHDRLTSGAVHDAPLLRAKIAEFVGTAR